jgi:hypothetical protein
MNSNKNSKSTEHEMGKLAAASHRSIRGIEKDI